jgi:hypothetical protein
VIVCDRRTVIKASGCAWMGVLLTGGISLSAIGLLATIEFVNGLFPATATISGLIRFDFKTAEPANRAPKM